jgi:hypothetical protein
VIRDPRRWNVGAARLKGFALNLPTWPHQKHVEEYHSILQDFESSCDSDFSSFRIPDSELNYASKSVGGYFEPHNDQYKYCDSNIFKSKIYGLIHFVVALRNDDVPPKKQSAKEPADIKEMAANIYIGEMHGSQFVQHSPGTTIKSSFNAKSVDFGKLVQAIKVAIPDLKLKKSDADQIHADVATIEAQIESPAPRYTIISESAESIRSILEGLAANVITTGLLTLLNYYFPK